MYKARGTSLSQGAIYGQLKAEAGLLNKPNEKKERRNSKRSRAHRLEEMVNSDVEVVRLPSLSPVLKMKHIINICDLYTLNWVTAENAVAVIGDIVKGQ